MRTPPVDTSSWPPEARQYVERLQAIIERDRTDVARAIRQDGEATAIDAQDWRVLLASLRQFGPSPDGAVERDLEAAITREVERRREAVARFTEAIMHGDEEHRAWLMDAADAFISDQPLPPPRSNNGWRERAEKAEAEVERLRGALRDIQGYCGGFAIEQLAGMRDIARRALAQEDKP